MRIPVAMWAALTMSVGAAPIAFAQQYDLVITNGRVMDPETMLDDVANVGVIGGRIAAITKSRIKGSETIDATGLVVAPGFIDTHFHAVDPFASKMAVADGITTGMDLEAAKARRDASPRELASTLREHSRWLLRQGEFERAEEQLLEAHDFLSGLDGSAEDGLRAVRTLLVRLYTEWDMPDEADNWQFRLDEGAE